MLQKRLILVLGLLLIPSMVLGACGPTPTAVPTAAATQPPAATAAPTEPPKPTRTGAWVDQVVFTEQNSADAAVSQLQAGDIDVYAYTVSDPNLFKTVKEDATLAYTTSFGSYNELTFNPAVFTDANKLNPFSNPKIREAMNWLIDRNYVSQEIFGGLAIPKVFPINANFPDYAKYVDVARKLEAFYAYNPDKAKEIITTEMEGMGATLGADGKWQYKGQPVTIIVLIRTEDKRLQIGDYVSNQLETVGFTVDRQKKTRSEASPIWVQGNPTDGLFNIYTGGWITTAISRDDGSNFSFFYTPRDYPIPLHQAYTPSAEFDAVALKLRNNDFKTMDERAQLFKQALELALQDSVRVWVVDQISFSPQKSDLQVTYDLAGGVAGSQLWPYTIRWKGQEGGTVKVAQPGIMVDPWNPVAGSNWIYDMMPIRATGDWGAVYDPYTGLNLPQRIEKADVTVKEGLPIAKTLDWLTLTTAAEISVPADAWADWDATAQKFITVGEKYPDGATANAKIVITYPADLFTMVKWHDGSPLSVGDFVYNMITTFDFGKEDSANYDAALAETLGAFLAHFKGVKIASTDPLVIETYDDTFYLDAEYMAYLNTWFPMYTYGPGAWHTVAMGAMADANKELAFSADKADTEGIEWMSFISGPSLAILKADLDKAAAESYIPFAATLGQYITADEANARWANLGAWYTKMGHFWVGIGPFYLDKVYPVEGTLTLARNPDYPDSADKWAGFGTPKIAVVEVDGPGNVKIGSEAVFDVMVTFEGQPYASADISDIKYLLFNAKGELVETAAATAVEDGHYQITLSAGTTSKLEAGSNKIEVAVSSKLVSIPGFGAFEFITAP